MNEKEKFIGKLMATMSQGFHSFQLTNEGIVWYSSILKDIPEDAIAAAAKKICSDDGQFMPSPGTWRQCALDIVLAKKGLPAAYEAWENLLYMGDGSPIKRVLEECDEQGRHYIESTERSWKHPFIEIAAKRCGWPDFPNPETLSYDRTTFIKSYMEVYEQADDDLRTPQQVKQVEQKYISTRAQIAALIERKTE
jgi:hypothetical protein